MNSENARKMARNIYAKYAVCTRRQAELIMEKVPDDACRELCEASPEDAEKMVKAAAAKAAQDLVNQEAKEPNETAQTGLNSENQSDEGQDRTDTGTETGDQGSDSGEESTNPETTEDLVG